MSGKGNLDPLLLSGALRLLSAGLRKVGIERGNRPHGEGFVVSPVNRALVLLGSALLMVFAGLQLVIGWLPEWAHHVSGAGLIPWPSPPRPWRWLLFLCALVLVYGYLALQLVRVARSARRTRNGLSWLSVAAVLLLPFVLPGLISGLWVPGSEIELFQLRARALGSGLSPLVALALLLGALFVWILCELKREWLVQRRTADCPLCALKENALAGCDETLSALHGWMTSFLPGKPWVWIVLTGVLVSFSPSLGDDATHRGYPDRRSCIPDMIPLVACFLTLLTFFRFVMIWLTLEPILQRLHHAFPQSKKLSKGNFTEDVDWKPMRSFAFQIPPFKMLVLSVQRLDVLIDAGRLKRPKPDTLLKDVFESDGRGLPLDEWRYRRSLEEVFEKACDDLSGHTAIPGVREFLALRVVAYLRYVFAHLRNSLMSAVGMGLLILIGVTAYAFQPKEFVSLAIWLTLAAGIASTFWIFLQMDRNPALSLISGTKSGEITFDKTFWTNFSLYVADPRARFDRHPVSRGGASPRPDGRPAPAGRRRRLIRGKGRLGSPGFPCSSLLL